MKNQKGITLIALVITIIVLLILAAVSIAMLTGENGILTQANKAKTDTSNAETAEKINMELNAFKADILAYGYILDDTVTKARANLDGATITAAKTDTKCDKGASITYNSKTGSITADGTITPASKD